MICWIKGDVVSSWQTNNKFFILINCQNLGYEIQILESTYIKLKTSQISYKNIIIWLKHIKKEDSDLLFGFISKDQKDFFNEILNIKGIGAQIGMALLNKLSIKEIIEAINSKDKKLINSVPGIGQKMTERIILELQSKFRIQLKNHERNKNTEIHYDNKEMEKLFGDLELILNNLSYPKKDIKNVLSFLMKDIKNKKFSAYEETKITFEILLREAMGHLNKDNSKLGQ